MSAPLSPVMFYEAEKRHFLNNVVAATGLTSSKPGAHQKPEK
jgi:hypothetical protein